MKRDRVFFAADEIISISALANCLLIKTTGNQAVIAYKKLDDLAFVKHRKGPSTLSPRAH